MSETPSFLFYILVEFHFVLRYYVFVPNLIKKVTVLVQRNPEKRTNSIDFFAHLISSAKYHLIFRFIKSKWDWTIRPNFAIFQEFVWFLVILRRRNIPGYRYLRFLRISVKYSATAKPKRSWKVCWTFFPSAAWEPINVDQFR